MQVPTFNQARAFSKASRYSLCLPPNPDNLSERAFALANKSLYCVVAKETSFRTIESWLDTGSMWGNRWGKLVLNSLRQFKYSLDSSTNFWALIVINRRSAWWTITSLTKSLVDSALEESLFKSESILSFSSRVLRALSIHWQNTDSSVLKKKKAKISFKKIAKGLPKRTKRNKWHGSA